MFKGIKRVVGKVVSKAKSVVVGGSLLGVAAVSHAAVDPAVTTAITDSGADAATLGAAVLVVLVSIVALKWLRRVL